MISKAIRTLVNGLCCEVRAQAIPLVDAFGIPDEMHCRAHRGCRGSREYMTLEKLNG